MRARGGSGVDIRLPDIWRSTPAPVRIWTTALYATLTTLAMLATGYPDEVVYGVVPRYWHGKVGVAVGALQILVTTALSARERTDLHRLGRIGLRGWRRRWRRIAVGAGIGCAVSLAQTLWPALVLDTMTVRMGVISAVPTVAVLSMVFGAALGLGSRPVTVDRPGALMTQVRRYDLVTVVAAGLLGGLVTGIVLLLGTVFAVLDQAGYLEVLGPFWVARISWSAVPSTSGGLLLATGALGVAVGLLLRALSPWPRYAVSVWVHARHGRLPRGLGPFLDWAYDAGLLRLSGVAFQFRHREFQEWLTQAAPGAERPNSGSASVGGTGGADGRP